MAVTSTSFPSGLSLTSFQSSSVRSLLCTFHKVPDHPQRFRTAAATSLMGSIFVFLRDLDICFHSPSPLLVCICHRSRRSAGIRCRSPCSLPFRPNTLPPVNVRSNSSMDMRIFPGLGALFLAHDPGLGQLVHDPGSPVEADLEHPLEHADGCLILFDDKSCLPRRTEYPGHLPPEAPPAPPPWLSSVSPPIRVICLYPHSAP